MNVEILFIMMERPMGKMYLKKKDGIKYAIQTIFFCYIFSVICLDFVFILQSKRREKLSGWNKKEDLRFIY